MIRTALGVILGYVAMVVVLFITLTAAYVSLGVDRTFEPLSYKVTTLWLILTFLFGFVAAVIGGKVCRLVSGRGWSLIPLIFVVLVMGAVSAGYTFLRGESNDIRMGEVSNLQAMANAREPKWVSITTPLIGVFGVIVGGKSRPKK